MSARAEDGLRLQIETMTKLSAAREKQFAKVCATRDELLEALRALREGVEADGKTEGYDPRNAVDAHTWVALAMRKADTAISKATGAA